MELVDSSCAQLFDLRRYFHDLRSRLSKLNTHVYALGKSHLNVFISLNHIPHLVIALVIFCDTGKKKGE